MSTTHCPYTILHVDYHAIGNAPFFKWPIMKYEHTHFEPVGRKIIVRGDGVEDRYAFVDRIVDDHVHVTFDWHKRLGN
jgi:hypothetical protein